MTMTSFARELFHSGRYQEILKSEGSLPPRDDKYRLAALVFMGREIEAQHLLESARWSGEDCVEVHFYILLSSLRIGDYTSMKRDLLKLYNAYQKCSSAATRFYLYQGLGLIRYYKGEFAKGHGHSRRSFRIALKRQDNYLCMIANDLMAHSSCMLEHYARGLQLFSDSLRFANKMASNNNIQVLELAQLTYKIEAGQELEKAQRELYNWIATIEPQDYFSKTNALLLKAKLLLLRGLFKDAEDLLLEISQQVYAFNQGRQILNYNLILGHLHFILHGPSKGLGLIRTSLQLCHKVQDYYYLHRFKELEYFAAAAPVKNKSAEALLPYASLTGRKSRLRYPLGIIPEESIDHYLKDEVPGQVKLSTLKKLKNKGLLGLLIMSGLYHAEDFIDLRLAERAVLLACAGNLDLFLELSSGQYELLRLLVSKTRWRRQDLFESFWRVPYDPFIHDNKLYVTLKRLKNKLLPTIALFHFEKGEIVVKNLRLFKTEQVLVARDHVEHFQYANFNPRQFAILRDQRVGELIIPREQAQLFGVSRNTVTRDLKDLVKRGKLIKIGQGRGTHYRVL